MFSAVIDTESLKDPRIVNILSIAKVVIEHEPNSEASKYHHIFFVKIEPEEIENKINLIAKELKEGWYAFFWDNQSLFIVFNKRSFKVKISILENDQQYHEAQDYGKSVNIQDEFLNFKEYFLRYQKTS